MATVLRPTVSRRAGSTKQQVASGHSSGEREESVSRISACANPNVLKLCAAIRHNSGWRSI